ncbi:MAG: hypothetical protein PHC28_03060 [Flavobacterium sp.]|uniref:hypothetical protein n=1 Tax=Flavobacterium sp. TaxID=239 RepID=UPI00260FF8BD|nr:hypothetical protein [Flavobacterium sp.]MDD5149447.1 hypothetical protein [Flavobacterium sp.]
MERYSKEYSSKWQSRYSEEFKRFVCNDYLTGSLTRREVEVKHCIGNSRLTYWLREIYFEDINEETCTARIKKGYSTNEENGLVVDVFQKLMESDFIFVMYFN